MVIVVQDGYNRASMLRELHKELGIPDDYGHDTGSSRLTKPSNLVEVGPNLVGRMQRLTPHGRQHGSNGRGGARMASAC